MSKSEILHDLYNQCIDIEFNESTELITSASTDDEKEFIRIVTDFALQRKQKKVIQENRF